MANSQAYGLSWHLKVVSLSFIPPLHRIFLGVDTDLALISLCTKGTGDTEQGKTLHLSCLVLQSRWSQDAGYHM